MRRVKKTPFPTNPELHETAILGAAVRASRTEAGMTLEEAAMTLGIAKQTLADLERGKPTVSLGTSLKVAREFGLTLFVLRNEDKNRLLTHINHHDTN